MAVNFKPVALANASEQKIFQTMELMEERLAQFWIKENVAFGTGSAYTLSCSDYDNKGKYQFSCSVSNDKDGLAKRRVEGRTQEGWEPAAIVSEVRYGDIDKDGDIDIAIKLSAGAIYVFHNLQADIPVPAAPTVSKPVKPEAGCSCSIGSRP